MKKKIENFYNLKKNYKKIIKKKEKTIKKTEEEKEKIINDEIKKQGGFINEIELKIKIYNSTKNDNKSKALKEIINLLNKNKKSENKNYNNGNIK
jgi:hypothetical protein